MIPFKEKLKELRYEKNLSQQQVAQALNVSQRSVSSWETGFRRPDYETLVKIATYFNVSVDYLLGLSND